MENFPTYTHTALRLPLFTFAPLLLWRLSFYTFLKFHFGFELILRAVTLCVMCFLPLMCNEPACHLYIDE